MMGGTSLADTDQLKKMGLLERLHPLDDALAAFVGHGSSLPGG